MTIAIIIIGTIAFVGIAGYLQFKRTQKRHAGLHAIATTLGLTYIPVRGSRHMTFSNAFEPFNQGDGQNSTCHLEGQWQGQNWEIFDYAYMTGHGKNRFNHRFTVISTFLSEDVGRICVRPEGFLNKMGALFGIHDIQTGNAGFDKAFNVRSDNPEQAKRLLTSNVIDFFMVNPTAIYQTFNSRVVLVLRGPLKPEQYETEMTRVVQLARLISLR